MDAQPTLHSVYGECHVINSIHVPAIHGNVPRKVPAIYVPTADDDWGRVIDVSKTSWAPLDMRHDPPTREELEQRRREEEKRRARDRLVDELRANLTAFVKYPKGAWEPGSDDVVLRRRFAEAVARSEALGHFAYNRSYTDCALCGLHEHRHQLYINTVSIDSLYVHEIVAHGRSIPDEIKRVLQTMASRPRS